METIRLLREMPFRTDLDIAQIPHHFFKDLIPAFPKLLKLDVSWSGSYDKNHHSINDHFLFYVGMFCNNLRLLFLATLKILLEHYLSLFFHLLLQGIEFESL